MQVAILSYPSLAIIAAPFKVPSGKLYGLDFSDSSLLITTDTALYLISLPLNIVARASGADDEKTHELELPHLDVATTIALPPLSVLGGGSQDDESVRTFRAGRFNPTNSKTMYTVINSAPPPGRSRKSKVERKSYLVRWELAATGGVVGASVGVEETWHARKVKNIGKRAITVFDVSDNGKLAAYGASDSSVGIVDARTFAPLLTILKAHDFPPTALQFNPRSTLLISGSADASLRVIVVPEFFTSSSFLQIVGLLLALLVVVGAIVMVPRS